MSVGFGFSVGDLITAFELVVTVIDALRASGEAKAEYRELLRQLHSLETALLQVKRLQLDDSRQSELIALWQAAAQCQRTIDEFWKRIQAYHSHLGCNRSGLARLKENWMKVKWATCKKDDVLKFKLDLAGHTSSIHLLLSTIQLASIRIQDQTQRQRQQSLTGKIQDSFFVYMRKLYSISDNVAGGLQQGKQLLGLTTQILRTNKQVLQIVLGLHDMIMQIPNQVKSQQPVFLVDALGREIPFHLEFVRSAEALAAVLAINFKRVGPVDKMRKGQLVLKDSTTKKVIDLKQDLDLCFFPGQRVELSVIIQRPCLATTTCPNCYMRCNEEENKDTIWW